MRQDGRIVSVAVIIAVGVNGTGRREVLLNGEIFYTLDEIRVVTGWWRDHYNKLRPHSALGYRPPAPETIMPSWRRSELTSHPDHSSQAVQTDAVSLHVIGNRFLSRPLRS